MLFEYIWSTYYTQKNSAIWRIGLPWHTAILWVRNATVVDYKREGIVFLLLHHNTSNHFQTLTCSNDGNIQPSDTTFLKRKNDKLHVLQYMMSCSHHIQFIASSSPWCKESMHFITCLGGNTAYSKILSKAKCLCATFTMHKTYNKAPMLQLVYRKKKDIKVQNILALLIKMEKRIYCY